MSISGALHGHHLFKALGIEEVDKISRFSSVKEYGEGEAVFQLDGAGSHVFLLIDGLISLRLPARAPGSSMMVALIEPAEIFGISPLLGSERYTSHGYAEEPSKVLAMEAKPLRAILTNNVAIGFHFMGRVAQIYFNRYLKVLGSLQEVASTLPLIR